LPFNLTTAELDRAFEAVNHHGYSALIPPPEEWAIVQAQWTSLRADLEKLDLEIYQPYPAMRFYAPKSRINIRPVTLLHPQDLVIYTALTLIVKDAVELNRIPVSERRVFSYRSNPSEPGQLYQAEGSYESFRKHLLDKAAGGLFIAVTDIADFYPRLYQHRLENVIRTVTPTGSRENEVARVLVAKFLGNVAGANSYGIPVGPLASRLLAEAVLIDVDEALLSEKVDFVRFVDDYVFFCKSRAEAQTALFFLGEWLFEKHGLTLQPVKTKILPVEAFRKGIESSFEQRLKRKSQSLRKIFRTIQTEDPYDASDWVPDDETLALIAEAPLVDLLKEALTEEKRIDYALAEFILGRVATITKMNAKIKRRLFAVVLDNIDALYPIAESITRFFKSVPDLTPAERRKIAKKLLRPLQSKLRPPDYFAMWVLHLFASAPEWGEATQIRHIYANSRSDVVRRYAALALASVGNRSHALAVTPDINGAVPMLKTAILMCSQRLGSDERKHWRKTNMTALAGFIEKAI
jgi:hypothetical protein